MMESRKCCTEIARLFVFIINKVLPILYIHIDGFPNLEPLFAKIHDFDDNTEVDLQTLVNLMSDLRMAHHESPGLHKQPDIRSTSPASNTNTLSGDHAVNDPCDDVTKLTSDNHPCTHARFTVNC